jgi:hypothetical protein
MAYVNFNRTKPASFALSESADKNTIYFTTDTHEIIINGESFGSTNLAELYDVIIENELTTSAALNDLDNRLLDTIDTATIDSMFL